MFIELIYLNLTLKLNMMKKIFFISLTGCLLAFSSFSQISATANGGIWLDGDGADALFGLNIEGKYDLNDNMRVGVATGWYGESESDPDFGTFSYGIIPITASYEYRLLDSSFRPYAGINAGIYMVRINFFGLSASESQIGFAPVVGADYAISDNFGINVNAKYNYIMYEGASDGAITLNFGVSYSF
jgi:opacity protein-like surface antigen